MERSPRGPHTTPRPLRLWWAGAGVLLVGVGTVVRDYRAGLGMPRSSKLIAITMMWTAITISAVVLRDRWWLPVAIAGLGVIGTGTVLWWVPTRERVLATRSTARVPPACSHRTGHGVPS